jgi:hypothetical protein
MFNFIQIYSFIPVSGCVCIGPGLCIVRGFIMLLARPLLHIYFLQN